MLLRETIHKTKLLLHKTLRNFKAFFFGGYQRLPRSLSFNPFTCSSANARTYTKDQFYNEFYDNFQSDLSRIKRVDTAMEDASSSSGSFMSFSKPSEQKGSAQGSHQVGSGKDQIYAALPLQADGAKNKHKGKKGDLSTQNMNGGSHDLAKKMKELEMMDAGDVEQVLDIEEALHYYSRLTSPVYLDIVDKFFVDMHSEFNTPQPYANIKHSKARLGSIRF